MLFRCVGIVTTPSTLHGVNATSIPDIGYMEGFISCVGDSSRESPCRGINISASSQKYTAEGIAGGAETMKDSTNPDKFLCCLVASQIIDADDARDPVDYRGADERSMIVPPVGGRAEGLCWEHG